MAALPRGLERPLGPELADATFRQALKGESLKDDLRGFEKPLFHDSYQA
jgi:hypothetical protein